MFPDQNQPTTPTVAPDPLQPGATPAPDAGSMAMPTPPEVASPAAYGQQAYAEPAPVPTSPVEPLPATPFAPVEPVSPVQASPAEPMPAAPPVMPPVNPVAPAQPVMDSSQIGYVPPANPVAPVVPMTGAAGGKTKRSGRFSKLRIVLAIIVGLGVFSGAGIFVKDTFFTGSVIKTSDLVQETESGVTFKRPKQWAKTDSGAGDFDVAYTEGGLPIDQSDQGVAVVSGSIDLNYDSLTQSEKDVFFQSFKDSFEKSTTGEKCKNISNLSFEKTSQPNYTDAYVVGYTCDAPTGRNAKGKFVMTIGLKGEKMNAVIVAAIDKTWNKSEAAFNEILNTFKPAE